MDLFNKYKRVILNQMMANLLLSEKTREAIRSSRDLIQFKELLEVDRSGNSAAENAFLDYVLVEDQQKIYEKIKGGK